MMLSRSIRVAACELPGKKPMATTNRSWMPIGQTPAVFDYTSPKTAKAFLILVFDCLPPKGQAVKNQRLLDFGSVAVKIWQIF